ncbi:MAG: hypothetical protein COB49_06755 [Alphaproteobacteria bacterium]|nr:MAG: hypothetical protein COB49_06755 [Alphaproteobacteria bacterium]
MPVLQKIYLFLITLLVVGLSGCGGITTQDPFYPTAITRADLLSGKALFGEQAKKITLPNDHVMEVSDDMRAYLQRYVPQNNGENTRVRLLARMIFGKGTLGMEYDASKTHTARDAFLRSEGNCLAFSYLFAAFARERGLKVRFQEVEIPPQWSNAGEELYYFSRHVNILIQMKKIEDLVIDINRVNYKPYYPAWKISDKYAIALYYSNKGTDYLYESDFENAFRYLAKALELSPRDASIWSNLGVMYRMKEMYDYAEKAYFIALKYDGRQQSVLSNLSVLYDHMGEIEKSAYYSDLARNHQMKNPYYRYFQAVEAYEEGNYTLSLSHLKVAVKRRGNEQKFHALLGETYAKLGDDARANKAWAKAKELLHFP